MLTRSTEGVEDVVNAWQELTRYIALQLSTRIGRTVTVALPSKHDKDPEQRLRHDLALLCDENRMYEEFSIPDAAAKVQLEANLAHRTLRCSMNMRAPQDRKLPKSCVTWIVNQLKKVEDPDSLLVFAKWPGRTQDTYAPLSVLRKDRQAILVGGKDKMPRSFDVALSWDLGRDFSRVQKFVEAAVEIIPQFYQDAGQHLRQWVPKPPQVKETKRKEQDSKAAQQSVLGEDTESTTPAPWATFIHPAG